MTGHVSCNTNRLFIPRMYTSFEKRSFYYHGCILWNNLRSTVVEATTVSFFKMYTILALILSIIPLYWLCVCACLFLVLYLQLYMCFVLFFFCSQGSAENQYLITEWTPCLKITITINLFACLEWYIIE